MKNKLISENSFSLQSKINNSDSDPEIETERGRLSERKSLQ